MTVLRAGVGEFFSSAHGDFEDTPLNGTVLSIYTNQPLGSLGTGTPSQTINLDLTGVGAVVAAPHYKLPVVYQWNVAIEQAIGQQTFSVGYVGAAGRRLIGSGVLLSLSAEPSLSFLHVLGNDASSSYNALQLQFNRRLSGKLQILTSYTFSHSIDDLSQEIPGIFAPRSLSQYLHPNVDRGSSDFDIRHTWNGAVIAELPAPRRGSGEKRPHWGESSAMLANWLGSTLVPGELNPLFQIGGPRILQFALRLHY